MVSYLINTKLHIFIENVIVFIVDFIILGCPGAAVGQTFECCMPLTFRSGRRNVNVKFTVTKCDEIQYSVERKQWTKAGLASISGKQINNFLFKILQRGCCGCDRMVDRFTTTYAISTYHH
jgi:hypothetical protein